jgi:hypothetical protein
MKIIFDSLPIVEPAIINIDELINIDGLVNLRFRTIGVSDYGEHQRSTQCLCQDTIGVLLQMISQTLPRSREWMDLTTGQILRRLFGVDRQEFQRRRTPQATAAPHRGHEFFAAREHDQPKGGGLLIHCAQRFVA